jgi:hypothetical protein
MHFKCFKKENPTFITQIYQFVQKQKRKNLTKEKTKAGVLCILRSTDNPKSTREDNNIIGQNHKYVQIVSKLSSLSDNLVDGFRNVRNVLGIQASHGYSSILGEVDVMLANHLVDLSWGQSGANKYVSIQISLFKNEQKTYKLNMPIWLIM